MQAVAIALCRFGEKLDESLDLLQLRLATVKYLAAAFKCDLPAPA